jgi:NAD(P)-dependent dehydrogenase (short-subunit alcohol dehydrogenase family)
MQRYLVKNMFDVSNKNVLITGGSRGIGLMMTKVLAANGANVFVSSRSKDNCDRVVSDLIENGCQAISIPHDVSLNSTELAESLSQHTDKLHVLINNSGTTWGQPLEEYDEIAWSKCFDLNVKAVFELTRACLPLLRNASRSEDPSRVVNVGSVTGFQHQPFPTYAYDSSKAAVHSLTKKLAFELAEDNITVNAIAPGYIPTKMSGQLDTYGRDEESMASKVPMGRLGRDTDMGGVVMFLCGQGSGAWVTGAVIPVDGGTLSCPLEI